MAALRGRHSVRYSPGACMAAMPRDIPSHTRRAHHGPAIWRSGTAISTQATRRTTIWRPGSCEPPPPIRDATQMATGDGVELGQGRSGRSAARLRASLHEIDPLAQTRHQVAVEHLGLEVLTQ